MRDVLRTPEFTLRRAMVGDVYREALFSTCERFRYYLRIVWGNVCTPARMAVVMLNPSTADEQQDDPTVARCVRRAQRLGYAALDVLNLFALRATDPRKLREVVDPIGPHNDEIVRVHAQDAAMVVCAWGVHGKLGGRDRRMLEALHGVELHALGVTKDGHPRHPLYLPHAADPKPWSPSA